MSRRTWGHRLFGWGRLPKRLRGLVKSEGVCWVEEGVRITITLRSFRAPGRYSARRRQSGSGALAVTSERLIVSMYRRPIIDLRFDDPRFQALEIDAGERGLKIAADAGRLDERRSGKIRLYVRTDHAHEIDQWIPAPRQAV